MTNKEALQATLDGIDVSALALEKALLDGNVSADSLYSAGQKKAVELCAIELLYAEFTKPDMQEGGFSVSRPDFLRKVQARLLYLARQHGRTDIVQQLETRPTVKGVSPW